MDEIKNSQSSPERLNNLPIHCHDCKEPILQPDSSCVYGGVVWCEDCWINFCTELDAFD